MNLRNVRAVCLLAWLAAVAAGCAYMNVQTPLDVNFGATQLGTKEGRSSAYSVLWLFAWGDAGSRAAAEQGGIKVIRHADRQVISALLGAYTRVTTVVYGD